jgi:toxin-antitoxin system PIN domain toxin
VIVVDLNLLLYATNRDAANHGAARAWWQATLSGDETIGLAWAVVFGFVRITTNPRILPRPLAPDQAFAVVDGWLSQPSVVFVEPTERHWGIVKDLLDPLGAAGNLTTDAHLAALAIERGAKLCSTDRDFGRFPRLHWVNPLEQR